MELLSNLLSVELRGTVLGQTDSHLVFKNFSNYQLCRLLFVFCQVYWLELLSTL